MSINEINAEAKESLRKYFKNSQDVKHENEARKELTKEENPKLGCPKIVSFG